MRKHKTNGVKFICQKLNMSFVELMFNYLMKFDFKFNKKLKYNNTILLNI